MAISNTVVLIKRSNTTTKPTTLNSGELAYSYLSNTLFIGNTTGTGVVNVGGQYYTTTLDNATSANVANTLVKRDANGAFAGYFSGIANSATFLANPQNFSISGGDIAASAVVFGGNNAVVLNASLNAVSGLSAGTYGSTSTIPIITVAANGRIMAISSGGSASINIAGNTGGSFALAGGNTFYIQGAGGSGIVTTSSQNTITIAHDTTVVRSNTTAVGPQTISTDLTVAGNLIVTGTQTYINTSTVQTSDSLIQLASNNTVGDVIDIGFYGASNTGSSVVYHGLVREGSGGSAAGNFYLFKNLPTNPTGNTVAYASLTRANLIANLTGGTVSGLAAPIAIADGGTNGTSFTTGQITYFNGTSIVSLANTGTAGTYGNAAYHPVITTDAYGRVSAVTNTLIQISGTQVTSGFTTGNTVIFNGTSLVSQANVTAINTTIAANNTVNNLTTDAYGRVTGYTTQAISGLTVPQGGTGTTTSTGTGSVVLNTSPTFGGTVNFGSAQVVGLNVQTINVTTINVTTFTANTISIGTLTYAATGNFVSFGANSNGFQQVVIQNSNTGTQASADFVVSNDVSTDSTTYGDFGINSSKFSGIGSLDAPNNVYLYAQSTDLVLGTNSANAIHFVVNHDATDAMNISSSGIVSLRTALAVGSGGTGLSNITQYGVTYGNGTAAAGVTAAAGTSDQTYSNQILTVTNAGVPTWSTTMDGGQF